MRPLGTNQPSVKSNERSFRAASRSCSVHSITLDTTNLSMPLSEINSNGTAYENTPSPSSIESASTITRPSKYADRILSSTLKSMASFSRSLSFYPFILPSFIDNRPLKRRSRYHQLLQHTHLINRKYMMNMTNILLQMQKEIFKLKRRTHHVEQLSMKQTVSVQPIIRIARLTEGDNEPALLSFNEPLSISASLDDLSTICTDEQSRCSETNDLVPNNREGKVIQEAATTFANECIKHPSRQCTPAMTSSIPVFSLQKSRTSTRRILILSRKNVGTRFGSTIGSNPSIRGNTARYAVINTPNDPIS